MVVDSLKTVLIGLPQRRQIYRAIVFDLRERRGVRKIIGFVVLGHPFV